MYIKAYDKIHLMLYCEYEGPEVGEIATMQGMT
jgi:hypothetical protein